MLLLSSQVSQLLGKIYLCLIDRLGKWRSYLYPLCAHMLLFALQFEISASEVVVSVVVSCIICVSPRYFVEMSSQIAYEVWICLFVSSQFQVFRVKIPEFLLKFLLLLKRRSDQILNYFLKYLKESHYKVLLSFNISFYQVTGGDVERTSYAYSV